MWFLIGLIAAIAALALYLRSRGATGAGEDVYPTLDLNPMSFMDARQGQTKKRQ
ncbi:hypothetical protein [Knoellia sp. Soil729]|uniref:hypothetical protein n=1 Tax=Knoellia sp. Soil729 TaxID=1736394 RepID=UPI000AE9741C|nr:hypothetical protein [Knoellia sp. Soil729]